MVALTDKQKQDGWQIVRFAEIARNISERVEPAETDLQVYVGLEHLDPQSLRITRHGIPSDVEGQKLRVRPGQIIFGKRRAYQKKLAVADFDGICSAHAMVLEAIPGKIVPELLPFFMQSDMFMDRAVAISEGSLSPTIKWKALSIQKFSLPPLERQKEILEVLEKTNAQISKLDEAIKSIDILKSQLEKEFFGSISISIKNDRDNNQIKIVPISYCCEIQTGGTPSRGRTEYWNGSIHWMSSGEINNIYIENTEEKITEKGLNNSNVRMLPVDSVLIAMNGQGKTRGLVAMNKIPLTCNQSIAAIICRKDILFPEYLFHYLGSKYEEIRGITGEGRNGLNLGLIKNFLIPIISLNEQLKIASTFYSILQNKATLFNKKENAKNILIKITDKLITSH